ncbi:aspartyl/asparaginyl beta-hydroxylase domain-containing protein [Nocardia gipuzkoensis]|uniref:aspartyl/asparaginyl beta-hydroxylase domain-containing protein n=1 Tax=Nocardia gipuzkoensis TaxID=2749991 RepID=UPI001E342FB4|nr:aspartyl/asparaginyl beta-hydroxylase domain-containing protein [Nocardia gipuzkoensis]UGT65322.1 aspartyl/asparaginyl beta-hydroxylase domain-containing protein [Nocardia gipuzkoensis]
MRFNPERLHAALAAISEDAWSLPSAYSETRVHHGYRRVVLVSARQPWDHAALFSDVLAAFAPVWEAWLSWIEPGGFIAPHRDAGPWRERWQVPIGAAGEWHGDNRFRPESGIPFVVQHWESHAVVNNTDQPRIHLVLDRDVWLDRAPEPFEVYPIPDDMTDLVQRSLT